MDSTGEATLRQFEILWAEIARRSNAQQALVAATVTGTGTVGGLVATKGAAPILLVVLAVVSPVFGLLWLDHARNINEIGRFIRENWTWTPNWEKQYEEGKNSWAGGYRFVVFATAVTIVFLIPAGVGLFVSIGELRDEAGLIAAWGGGAIMTVLFTISWILQIAQTRPRCSQ